MKRTGPESDDGSASVEVDEQGIKRAKMPKKAKHRMRAHINPLGDMNFPVPKNPSYVDWSIHFPLHSGHPDNLEDKMFCNTGNYQITYPAPVEAEKYKASVKPDIVDIGCGYGGLLFSLSLEFPNKMALGMEIRDKVTNFVVQKINTMRINSQYVNYGNIAVVRTNTMKSMLNYFEKESLEKLFFCFADPHFKKVNYRRRIINTNLLSDYAYCLKEGGLVYEVTDVKDLHEWNVSKLEQHPLFEKLTEEEMAQDPCIAYMRGDTDESKKVQRIEGDIWHAVFRKKSLTSEEKLLPFFM